MQKSGIPATGDHVTPTLQSGSRDTETGSGDQTCDHKTRSGDQGNTWTLQSKKIENLKMRKWSIGEMKLATKRDRDDEDDVDEERKDEWKKTRRRTPPKKKEIDGLDDKKEVKMKNEISPVLHRY